MKKSSFFLLLVLLVAGLASCKKFLSGELKSKETFLSSPILPDTPFDYEGKHVVDNELATLGRVLFYDKALSVNDAVSCGSCHKQDLAFASPERFDKGFDGQLLKRNTPSIQGLKGFGTHSMSMKPDENNQIKGLLFWDGRQNNLANMVLNPVLNHREMSIPDFETLVKKLSAIDYYPPLFEKAFGTKEIDKTKIAYALESFIQCLDPNPAVVQNMDGFATTPFPPVINKIDTAGFTELEKYGRFLFHTQYNCATCHDPSHSGSYGAGSLSGVPLMFNIGLDANYNDKGLGAVTNRAADNGVFKVPTLMNIALTAPYMHDGRFKTLSEVLDHYSHNIQANPQLSAEFVAIGGGAKQLNISASQKEALIAFLHKLTTPDFISHPMYSNPFVAR